MNELPYVNENLFLCIFNLLTDCWLIFWALFSVLIFCVKYNTNGVFTPECTWPKINNGLKSKTVFASHPLFFSLNRPKKEISSNHPLSERKSTCVWLWAGTPSQILSNQTPMSDLIIVLRFQLFNHPVCWKMLLLSVPPPPHPHKGPRTYNWPSRQEAIKKKSNTWGASRSN